MTKVRTNLSVESLLVSEAKALQVNMSLAAETGIRDAVRRAREAAWRRENADAIRSSCEWVEKHGIPLSRYRQF